MSGRSLVGAFLLVACGSAALPAEDGGAHDAFRPRRDSGPIIVGDPGCGLGAAAFCETFDAPSSERGRAGELDWHRFSLGRGNPQGPSNNGSALPVGPATIGECRGDLPAQVFPPQDTLVCDPTDGIASRHLLVAVGAQNYGQNSYRIRQPFDFEGRTGRIVFDAEGYVLGGLFGWVSIEITEDPAPIPGFQIDMLDNDEGSTVPRSAIEVQLQSSCQGVEHGFTVRLVDVVRDYADIFYEPNAPGCVRGEQGHLNRFQIDLSRTHIAIRATPASADGVSFEPAVLLYETDIDLPFERGYVHLTTHNHATRKYSVTTAWGAPHPIDAWVARWDNVGFDGPVIAAAREHEVADSLFMTTDAWELPGPVMNTGYRVADVADGPREVLLFHGVDAGAVTRARLALSAWYLPGNPLSEISLRYRINGGPWHDRMLEPGERRRLSSFSHGSMSQMIELDPAELIDGDNTLELVSVNVGQGYPAIVHNIDLILD